MPLSTSIGNGLEYQIEMYSIRTNLKVPAQYLHQMEAHLNLMLVLLHEMPKHVHEYEDEKAKPPEMHQHHH
ncbi:hypothetical protein E2562_036390 [Oryza meyeriana var. granulata]|uniref:Uncharacterized protein n=1 Tax=Oryza meyeriana var. granulata TaxID=110450 RepID=A0A6G1F1X2_9ORYZ|nr:hypothetical protein E2562_036390 [Oryza meyeriana var. granulata]